jgi:N-acyl-phosphatidylethanolamine-hydrolysing phospholipase D
VATYLRRLGFAVFVLAVTFVAGTSALEEARLPHATRLHGTFRNLDAQFWSPSNWTRVRFYLLGSASMLNADSSYVPLETAVPDVVALRTNRHAATVTWVGHSTLLVQLDGVNILTDPTWSARVGPWSGTVGVRRFTPPGIAFDDLPPIDVVLISHDHYDHLDEATVRRLARAFHPRFVVPLGLKAWLAAREITNVSELDWSESITVKGLTIVCAPAQHGSGRSPFDGGERLWASWVVSGSKRFYFAGDSGYAAHLAMIGAAFGPFDLAALPIGSYTPREIARPVHMSPEEALQGSLDLRATKFIGIHWGTFELAREPADEPPRRIAAEVVRLKLDPRWVWIPTPGATLAW